MIEILDALAVESGSLLVGVEVWKLEFDASTFFCWSLAGFYGLDELLSILTFASLIRHILNLIGILLKKCLFKIQRLFSGVYVLTLLVQHFLKWVYLMRNVIFFIRRVHIIGLLLIHLSNLLIWPSSRCARLLFQIRE